MESNSMKKLLLAFAFALISTVASAQCNGIFANNTICGNISGASNLPRPIPNSALTGVPGGTNGQIQYNNAGNFGGFTLSGDCTIPVIAAGAITCPLFAGTLGYALIGNGAPAASYQGFIASGSGATTRTWQNKGRDIIDVKDFGAVCDGSTDDSSALNTARLALQAAGGGTLNVPDGTCIINSNSALQFTAGNIVLQGNGSTSIIKAKSSAGLANIVVATNPARLLLKNIAIDGNTANGGMASTSYGVLIQADNSELNGVHIYNVTSVAIALTAITNTFIHNSYIHDNQKVGMQNIGGGVPDTVRIVNNYFANNYNTTTVSDNAALNIAMTNFIVNNNQFYNNFNINGGQLAIACGATKGTISGNYIRQAGTVVGEGTMGIESCAAQTVISGNNIENTTNYGINIEGDITDVLVESNRVFANSNAFSIITSGCAVCPKKISFIGNQARFAGASGAGFSIGALGATGNDIVILSNYIDNSITTPISGAGNASMIMGNYGYFTIGNTAVLPTSCAGQPTGTLRNNSGVVNVC